MSPFLFDFFFLAEYISASTFFFISFLVYFLSAERPDAAEFTRDFGADERGDLGCYPRFATPRVAICGCTQR